MNENTNNRRVIGWEQEYPGSYRWPRFEYRCPDCQTWTTEIHGDIDGPDEHGEFTPLCKACGTEVEKEFQPAE